MNAVLPTTRLLRSSSSITHNEPLLHTPPPLPTALLQLMAASCHGPCTTHRHKRPQNSPTRP